MTREDPQREAPEPEKPGPQGVTGAFRVIDYRHGGIGPDGRFRVGSINADKSRGEKKGERMAISSLLASFWASRLSARPVSPTPACASASLPAS